MYAQSPRLAALTDTISRRYELSLTARQHHLGELRAPINGRSPPAACCGCGAWQFSDTGYAPVAGTGLQQRRKLGHGF